MSGDQPLGIPLPLFSSPTHGTLLLLYILCLCSYIVNLPHLVPVSLLWVVQVRIPTQAQGCGVLDWCTGEVALQ